MSRGLQETSNTGWDGTMDSACARVTAPKNRIGKYTRSVAFLNSSLLKNTQATCSAVTVWLIPNPCR